MTLIPSMGSVSDYLSQIESLAAPAPAMSCTTKSRHDLTLSDQHNKSGPISNSPSKTKSTKTLPPLQIRGLKEALYDADTQWNDLKASSDALRHPACSNVAFHLLLCWSIVNRKYKRIFSLTDPQSPVQHWFLRHYAKLRKVIRMQTAKAQKILPSEVPSYTGNIDIAYCLLEEHTTTEIVKAFQEYMKPYEAWLLLRPTFREWLKEHYMRLVESVRTSIVMKLRQPEFFLRRADIRDNWTMLLRQFKVTRWMQAFPWSQQFTDDLEKEDQGGSPLYTWSKRKFSVTQEKTASFKPQRRDSASSSSGIMSDANSPLQSSDSEHDAAGSPAKQSPKRQRIADLVPGFMKASTQCVQKLRRDKLQASIDPVIQHIVTSIESLQEIMKSTDLQ